MEVEDDSNKRIKTKRIKKVKLTKASRKDKMKR